MKRSEAKRSCLEQSLSPLPVANLSRSRAWVHVPAWPGWWGGVFVCCIKPICVLSGGGAAAALWRGSSSHWPDPATSHPREPRSGAAFVPEEDTDPRREARAGGEMGRP